jgi:hypothetical protein
MAEIDLFSPEISKVVKGMDGKIILIYGCNKCGKTYNAVQAPKPLVLAFERGLGALNGVPFFPIRNWGEFRSIVKKLSDPKNFDALHEKYETIIVDAIDGIEKLSDRYVCNLLGIDHIRDYNGGYGAWKEWGDEIESQLRLLVGSGFTIIFIGHEGSRKFLLEDGKTEYEMVYPRGDKRGVDPILNYVDLTCYVRLGTGKDNGDQELSTLYLKGNRGFFAGGRFPEIRPMIREWSYSDLENALIEAIELREKRGGFKAITHTDARTEEIEKQAQEDSLKLPIPTLVKRIFEMVTASMKQTGSKDEYAAILANDVGDPGFRCNQATEDQREQVEIIYDALLKKGYTFTPDVED